MIGMDCVNQQARRDLISRLSEIRSHFNCFDERERETYHTLSEAIEALSRVTSAQPSIRCKDCGHFHYDMPYVIQGVPVLGHEVCDFWGDGCKTSENGYCSFAERKTDGADVNT